MSQTTSRRGPFSGGSTTTSMLGLLLLLCLLFAPQCAAHMVMSEPPPINYKTNPHYNTAKADFDYTAPLSPSGSNYPCRGHLKDLDTPEGASVRDYAPGGTYDLKIDGGAAHGGGSCQVSLSFDGGVSYTVIKSYIGDCPHASGGGAFQFTIPQGTPAGTAVFAWTWFNQIGNREMYMNCAVVTITGGSSRIKRALTGPAVFVANVGNGCTTAAGTDVVFPDAGEDVAFAGDAGKRADPVGTCNGKSFTGGGATGGGTTGGGTGGDTGTGTGTTGGGGGGTGTGTGGTTVVTGDNGNAVVVDEGTDGQGCDYWRQQGYICSAGPPTMTPIGNGIAILVISWVGLGFVLGLV